jgi:photosystem II stability/assembly factor-like uncharacterized protein
MKVLVFFIAAVAFVGCQQQRFSSQNGAVPLRLTFEQMRLQSPITGEVPSELKYANLPTVMGLNSKNKTTKQYPNTWEPVDDKFASLSVSKISYDPNNLSTYYFCTGEGWFNADAARGNGIWKSNNAGETWTQLVNTANSTFYYCQDLIVHPITSHIYVTTRDGGLQRSKDEGVTWEQVLGQGNGANVDRAADLELTADNEIIVSFGIFNTDGIYKSTSGDAGDWQKLTNGLPIGGYGRIELATAKSNENVMYAIPHNNNDNRIMGIWRSADKGITWMQVTSPGGDLELAKQQAWYDLIIEVDPNDENVVVVGGLNIWKSNDGGATWQQLTEGDKRKASSLQYVHVDQHGVEFKNSDTVYFMNDGGIYRSDNFTSDMPILYAVNANYNVTQFYAVDIHPNANENYVVGGTQDNGTNASTGVGISEFSLVSWADGGYSNIDYEEPKYVYSTTQEKRVYRNVDGRSDTISNPKLSNANTLFINPIILDASDPQTLYQASNLGVWMLKNARTADSNQWKQICRPFGAVSALATSVSAPNTVYFGRSHSIFRIDNADSKDENYTPIFMDKNNELPVGAYINCIVPDDLNKNHIVVIYTNYDVASVFETYDAYEDDPTWTSCEGNLPNIPIRWGCFKNGSSNIFYLATEAGVYYTEKLEGANTVWVENNKGLPNLRMDLIKSRKSDNTFAIATHGRGIFVSELGPNNTLDWKERGPNNIGGRTRTILLDPNDPSGQKVWAGNVSGGLWVVQNIDSANAFIVVAGSSSLDVYPNPAESILKLKFNETNEEAVTVKIYNNLGQLILEKIISTRGEYELDVQHLADGILYVRLTQGAEQVTKKIVKQPR